MALPSAGKGPLKESFAKVAAMAVAVPRQFQAEVSSSSISSSEVADQSSTTNTSLSSGPPRDESALREDKFQALPGSGNPPRATDMDALGDATKALRIEDGRSDITSDAREPGSESHAQARGDTDSSVGEVQALASQLSRKPSSLDGKSATSANTFGIDEKESLRPDDSASVKATEDEDVFAPGSAGDSSQIASNGRPEAQPRFYVLSQGMQTAGRAEVATAAHRAVTPQLSDLKGAGQSVATNAGAQPAPVKSVTLNGGGVPLGFSLEPDEKLVEALENPKDRLFVLRLEQDVIEFVKDSKELFLEVPPCNSFCRLLVHKLADYYFLTHFVDASINSVRIYRTPFCRLPPPLTGISNPPTSGNTPPPSGPAVKIMRRGAAEDLGSRQPFRANSLDDPEAHARPESTAGENPSETQQSRTEPTTKERGNLTREEREAKYKEARERIFKGFEESETDDRSNWAESTKHSSRSSSRTGKNRVGGKRLRNDDGFELRSQYAAYYQSPQQGFAPFTAVPSYGPYPARNPAFPGNDIGAYPSRDMHMQHMVVPQQMPFQANGAISTPGSLYSEGSVGDAAGQSFQAAAHASSVASTHSDASSPLPTPNEYSISAFQPGPPGAFPAGVRPHAYPPQVSKGSWAPFPAQHPYPPDVSTNPSLYPHGVDRANVTAPPMAMPTMYPYGQLPNQLHQHGGYRINHQHPLPGSFNRRAFNPQTQPFVPGHQQAMGQAHPYGPPMPHASNFPGSFQPPATMPPTFSMSAHGPHHNVTPHLTPAHLSQPGNTRFPATGSSPAGAINVPHSSPADRRTQANEPLRWNHPASLPPKPPIAAPTFQSPNPAYPHVVQRQVGYGEGPQVAVGSYIPSTSGSLPARSPR